MSFDSIITWLNDPESLGTIPAWFGGLSLLLAFRLFLRDRKNNDRAEIDKVVVWWSTKYDRRMPGQLARVEEIEHTLHAKNSSDGVVTIEAITARVSPRWVVPDLEQTSPELPVWSVEPGVATDEISIWTPFDIPPDDKIPEHAQPFNVAHHAKVDDAQIEIFGGATITVLWFLAVDNVGKSGAVRGSLRGESAGTAIVGVAIRGIGSTRSSIHSQSATTRSASGYVTISRQ